MSALQSALKDAKDVLADKDAMQAEIDKAREALQDAKDALEERNAKDVDKTRLEKLVTDAKKYEDSIDKYTKDTADLFTKVLADAKAVLADDKASQEEVNLAHDALRNAIFGLRLIPNKDALKELIQNAEKVDLTKYTEKSVKAFRSALAYAKSVWEDENATEEDVKAAEKQLQKAQKNLVAKAEKPEKEDNQSGSADKNINGGKTESADEGTTGTGSRTESTNKTTKAAKTGDAGSAMSMGMTLLAAMVSAGAVFTKRRKNNVSHKNDLRS